MKLEKVHINTTEANDVGLDEINISRLGRVVALVGRNGAGKSRVLQLLEEKFIRNLDIVSVLDGTISSIPAEISEKIQVNDPYIIEMYVLRKRMQELNNIIKSNQDDRFLVEFDKASKRFDYLYSVSNYGISFNNSNAHHQGISERIYQIIPKYFIKILHKDIIEIKKTIDKSQKDLVSYNNLLDPHFKGNEYNEVRSINESGWVYIQSLPHRLSIDKGKCLRMGTSFNDEASFKSFKSFKEIVFAFLNLDLDWEEEIIEGVGENFGTVTHNGYWTLDGKNFIYEILSPGQKTLFTYCLLFFLLSQNPNVKIHESIIVIDEPELHLHPESELAVVKGVKNIIKEKGQLWIATHSINVLSHLSPDEIFLIKDRKIIGPSRTTPHNSLIDLVGKQLEQFSHFITDMSNWAYLNFMIQNFNDPDTIESAQPNDPQVEVFKQALKTGTESSILLDFGAGKGRMYKGIKSEEDLSNKIEYYYAIEPNEDNHAYLNEIGIFGCYNDYKSLEENKFDYILLCNVLHEIEPVTEWPEILNKLKNSLKNNGFLIIIEDQILPKGEKIGKEGFLVMDLSSLKLLFGLDTMPSQILSLQPQFTERILCALINKNDMKEISKPMVKEALKKLMSNTLTKIKINRAIEPTKENKIVLGRESGFYSQLYINCLLAIEKLK